ncbi:phosphate propanoyltransferase [Desulfoluna butyratoxydans]|uniref:Phosphate propanoyltransferase n=1 Tax=Desulfoluna butyratoxydans TaxID=231438 RepID=A0A4U8YN85_9BACT|nr:phosphate propanoyltransferase [Desulfoluna butyratoxydans]VFQ45054.1 phosphate propanoyltransferase [Desulfoluna butyratoxydans]
MQQTIVEDIIKKVMDQMGETPAEKAAASCDAAIPVELSGRHVHLCEEDIKELFGGPLTHVKELSQPGQYLCKERVRLIGPSGVIDNVAVLGPARPKSQVELSLTDARILGIKAPVRQSGDVAGTPGVVLTSGSGLAGLEEGVIVAARHIHMSPGDAARFGVSDNQKVDVHMDGSRPAVFKDVIVRVNKDFRLAMHIDFDEANSCGLGKNARGRIVGVTQEA